MIRHRLTIVVFALLASLCVVDSGRAQVAQIRPSGCPGAFFPTPGGSPRIGQTFRLFCPPCFPSPLEPFVHIEVGDGWFDIQPPLACGKAPCRVIGGQPILTARPVVEWVVRIPRDKNLVGASVVVQCGCIEREPCLHFSGAVRVTILP